MKVAVIGAGVAGLTTLRQVTRELPEAEVTAFEIGQDIGGTWRYTDEVGVDKYGIPLTTSMYSNLRANLPKQVMELSDYPMPPNYKTFVSHNDFHTYLQNYANHFNLRRHIKYEHMVSSVKPIGDGWQIIYKDLPTGCESTEEFDYVFICNGHYNKQVVLDYKGQDIFKGKQIHSGRYRKPEPYAGRRVLIIGSGPSGLDISVDVARFAKKVYLSHHWDAFKSPFPPNYVQKPTVREFTEDSVVFVDGSSEQIDDVIHCTGYSYNCPFLDKSCGVTIERTHINHLYRHIVNCKHPSMFFIGVPQLCCTIPIMEFQAKYVAAALSGKFKLPTKEQMMQHTIDDYEKKDKSEFKVERIATHLLGIYEQSYCEDMTRESGVRAFAPVITAMRLSAMDARSNLYTCRDLDYHVIDDHNFIITRQENRQGDQKDAKDSADIVEIVEGPVWNDTMSR